jgi:hypothetical protein
MSTSKATSDNKRKKDNWFRLSIKIDTAKRLDDLSLNPDESYNNIIIRLLADHDQLVELRKMKADLSLEQINEALKELTVRNPN